ncbi:MAG: hypothetical protein ACUVXI_12210 [bacterium]
MPWWIIPAVLALMIPILAIVLNSPVGKGIAEWMGRKAKHPQPSDANLTKLTKRVEALELELEEANRRIEYLQEGYRFVDKLLERESQRRELEKG